MLRRRVRRRTAARPGEDALTIRTDLLDSTRSPAGGRVDRYRVRWGAEGTVRTVPQVVASDRFVGSTPEATVLPASGGVVRANRVPVPQADVRAQPAPTIDDVAATPFVRDWRRRVVAPTDLVEVPMIGSSIPRDLTAERLGVVWDR
jgi:hypothetical protein